MDPRLRHYRSNYADSELEHYKERMDRARSHDEYAHYRDRYERLRRELDYRNHYDHDLGVPITSGATVFFDSLQASAATCTPPSPISKPKSLLEMLQAETDEWLKSVKGVLKC